MSISAHKDNQAEFKRKQYEFTAHIRDPEVNPLPDDVEDRRMKIYRELFYNNIEGFISNSFPVIREIFDDQRWHAMIRDFFSRHQCQTPYFLEIAEEFIDYLQNERDDNQDPAFLLELAHYEWAELALSVSEDAIENPSINPDGDMLNGIPVISPLAWLLSYQFDVQHIGPDYQPEAAPEQPTTLVVYRNREDEVGFMEVNPITAHLLQSIQLNPDMSGEIILRNIAEELNHPDPAVVIKGGEEIIKQLREADILLGSRK